MPYLKKKNLLYPLQKACGQLDLREYAMAMCLLTRQPTEIEDIMKLAFQVRQLVSVAVNYKVRHRGRQDNQTDQLLVKSGQNESSPSAAAAMSSFQLNICLQTLPPVYSADRKRSAGTHCQT